MTTVRARPRRSVRHELASLAVLAFVPAAILAAFPYEAMSFRPAEGARDVRPACAFVVLGEDEEHAALAAARTSWQVDSKSVRRMRVDLSADDLPPEPVRPIIRSRPRRFDGSVREAVYLPGTLPPTVAAPRAPAIPSDPEGPAKPAPAFPREEMIGEL